jgi:hypothetical protein
MVADQALPDPAGKVPKVRRVWHVNAAIKKRIRRLRNDHHERIIWLMTACRDGYAEVDDRALFGRVRVARSAHRSLTYGLLYVVLPVQEIVDYSEEPLMCLGFFVAAGHAVPVALRVGAWFRGRRWVARWTRLPVE